MQRWQRMAIAVLAVLWVLAAFVADAVSHTTRHIRAERVSANQWREALASPARVPVAWSVASHRQPPLLPTRGEYTIRADRIALNGAAIVAGTAGLRDFEFTVEVSRQLPPEPHSRNNLILPFWPQHRPAPPPSARSVDLCWGIAEPSTFAASGLRFRSADRVTVYGSDGTTELFPGRRIQESSTKDPWLHLSVTVAGTRIVVSRDGVRTFDFHTNRPAVGAVGIETHEGAVLVRSVALRTAG